MAICTHTDGNPLPHPLVPSRSMFQELWASWKDDITSFPRRAQRNIVK